jgi:hypothetical protein
VQVDRDHVGIEADEVAASGERGGLEGAELHGLMEDLDGVEERGEVWV